MLVIRDINCLVEPVIDLTGECSSTESIICLTETSFTESLQQNLSHNRSNYENSYSGTSASSENNSPKFFPLQLINRYFYIFYFHKKQSVSCNSHKFHRFFICFSDEGAITLIRRTYFYHGSNQIRSFRIDTNCSTSLHNGRHFTISIDIWNNSYCIWRNGDYLQDNRNIGDELSQISVRSWDEATAWYDAKNQPRSFDIGNRFEKIAHVGKANKLRSYCNSKNAMLKTDGSLFIISFDKWRFSHRNVSNVPYSIAFPPPWKSTVVFMRQSHEVLMKTGCCSRFYVLPKQY